MSQGKQVYLIPKDGRSVRCLYTELIDLSNIGELKISRASRVEPNEDGTWSADMAPVGGPILGPFTLRSEALEAEVAWLNENVLSR